MSGSATRRLGLLVNPIAGLGGAVGLKGTDGTLAAAALARGAMPRAERRAIDALAPLSMARSWLELLTSAGPMGETAARQAGFAPRVVHAVPPRSDTEPTTSAADTIEAARAIAAAGAELVLFVGGDGTARDVLAALGESVPVLGVPAGVKMHSAVFATGPRAAGDVALRMLGAADGDRWLTSAEVMDREPAPDGSDPPSPRLYGTLRVPLVPRLVQRAKAAASLGDEAELEAACHRVAALARDGATTVLGPGSTLLRIKRRLGIDGTLLGADVVRGDALLARDAGEQEILDCLGPPSEPARVVVTVVGGQGFLFGRGNQQIGARVLRRVGRDGIVVVAALEKLATLPAGGLLVDTGDEALDRELAGYLPVITGGARQAICRVLPASP